MRTFKRTLLAGAVTVALAASGAASAQFNNLVFFGDSLSDAGYYGARFTVNPGLVWAQNLGNAYGMSITPSNQGGTNYAQGGARVTLPSASTPSGAPQRPVSTQIGELLQKTPGLDPSTLYAVMGRRQRHPAGWGGGGAGPDHAGAAAGEHRRGGGTDGATARAPARRRRPLHHGDEPRKRPAHAVRGCRSDRADQRALQPVRLDAQRRRRPARLRRDQPQHRQAALGGRERSGPLRLHQRDAGRMHGRRHLLHRRDAGRARRGADLRLGRRRASVPGDARDRRAIRGLGAARPAADGRAAGGGARRRAGRLAHARRTDGVLDQRAAQRGPVRILGRVRLQRAGLLQRLLQRRRRRQHRRRRRRHQALRPPAGRHDGQLQREQVRLRRDGLQADRADGHRLRGLRPGAVVRGNDARRGHARLRHDARHRARRGDAHRDRRRPGAGSSPGA